MAPSAQPISALSFESADPRNAEHCAALTCWANDPTIRHLFRRHPGPASYRDELSTSDTAARLAASLGKGQLTFMVRRDGVLIGELGLMHRGDDARLSIVLGSWFARGVGLARPCLDRLEVLARERGATQCSVAVFAFHEHARSVYHHLGYRQVEEVPGQTFWEGRVWPELVLVKTL